MKTLNFTTIAKIITAGTILSLSLIVLIDVLKNGTSL
jgi:hypothetical protein